MTIDERNLEANETIGTEAGDKLTGKQLLNLLAVGVAGIIFATLFIIKGGAAWPFLWGLGTGYLVKGNQIFITKESAKEADLNRANRLFLIALGVFVLFAFLQGFASIGGIIVYAFGVFAGLNWLPALTLPNGQKLGTEEGFTSVVDAIPELPGASVVAAQELAETAAELKGTTQVKIAEIQGQIESTQRALTGSDDK